MGSLSTNLQTCDLLLSCDAGLFNLQLLLFELCIDTIFLHLPLNLLLLELKLLHLHLNDRVLCLLLCLLLCRLLLVCHQQALSCLCRHLSNLRCDLRRHLFVLLFGR